MKKVLLALPTMLLLAMPLSVFAQTPDQKGAKDLRGILVELLKTTHNQKDWFVPGNTAMDGLTAEQAKWSDGKGNHSVGQLTYHLVYWDSEQLAKFKGEKPPAFDGNNEETFNDFDAKKWAQMVKQFDTVMTEWEKAVAAADDKKLAEWASTIEHVAAHNAYHIGQIIYVRKQQGAWDPAKGVK
jgi:uncharacterized damage-inducible protein DinB